MVVGDGGTKSAQQRELRMEVGSRECPVELAVWWSSPGVPQGTVLCVHGLGCTKESFAELWDTALGERHALCAVDLPGHGAAGRTREHSYRMEDQAALLLEMLAELGAGQVHLVAHSMGGAIGLLLARQLGDRLASFVNVEGNLLAADCGLISRRTARASFDKFRSRQLPVFLEAVASSKQRALQEYARQLGRCDPWAFWRASASLVDWSDGGELLEIFRELEVPKVYLYGERSVLPEVIAALEGIEQVGMPDSGHFVMHDAPAAFWAVVERVVAAGQAPP